MGFHLFANNVYDEDLCFVRDLTEVGSAIASVTSIPVMRQIINDIIEKYGLQSKLQEYIENQHYIIKDAYPGNRSKRLSQAKELLNIAKRLRLNDTGNATIVYAATQCIKRMEFSYEEKIQLIKDCLITTTGNPDVDNMLINSYIDLF